MFSIALTNAVTKPRTVMVVGWYAFLANPTVLCSQWHVKQTLRAKTKSNFNFASSLTSLNRCQVFLSILLIRVPILIEVSILRILDNHLCRNISICCQCIQMLFHNMLSCTPLHLSCVLHRHNLLIHNTLSRWINSVISPINQG